MLIVFIFFTQQQKMLRIFIDDDQQPQQRTATVVSELKPKQHSEVLTKLQQQYAQPISKYFDAEKVGLIHVHLASSTKQQSKNNNNNNANDQAAALVSLWKPLFPLVINNNSLTISQFAAMAPLIPPQKQATPQQPFIAVLCINAGRFAGAVYSSTGKAIVHKCFQKYVKRQKQGKAQLNYDKAMSGRNAPSSAGAQMRRLMAAMFVQELRELVFSEKWSSLLSQSKLIAINAPGKHNTRMLKELIFGAINNLNNLNNKNNSATSSSSSNNNIIIETIPFPVTSKPTFATCTECFTKITTIHVTMQQHNVKQKLESLKRDHKRVRCVSLLQPVQQDDTEEDDELEGFDDSASVKSAAASSYLSSPPTTPLTPQQIDMWMWVADNAPSSDDEDKELQDDEDEDDNGDGEGHDKQRYYYDDHDYSNEEANAQENGEENEEEEATTSLKQRHKKQKPTQAVKSAPKVTASATPSTKSATAASSSIDNNRVFALVTIFGIIPLIFIIMMVTSPGGEFV